MEFRVLGPLEVVDADRHLELGGRRQRALLACLLIHANEVVAAERLVEELWGGGAAGANALQISVSRLRKALGPDERLLTRPPGYLLRVSPGELDRDEFERLCDEARHLPEQGQAADAATRLRRALALWRGPPFADFLYEPFAQAEIARLDETHLACLEERIDADLAVGRHTELVGELEALTKEHPVRERLRAQLMLALYRCGRQADALGAYQEARQILVEELGIEPSDELRELEQAILRQDPQLKPPASPVAAAVTPEPPVSLQPVPATRRTVTVLVAGDSEPTPARVDPELRRHRGDRFFALAAPVLERHGALVERLRDDRVMGLFGVPAAHEDDALRAIRAAVELLDALVSEGNGLCVGIDTGEVLTGDATVGERLVTGDAVERAASLQQSSRESGVVIGDATRSLVRDAIRAEPSEPDASTPESGPVWRLIELLPAAPPLVRRFDAPLVGREADLAHLRQTYERASRERRAHLVTVFGEAGIGKTRLAQELARSVQAEATVLTGRCLSYGEGITYSPVREIVTQAAAGRDIRDLLDGSPDADVVAARLESAIGAGTAGAVNEEVFWAFRKLAESLARNRRLVLVFEDVHWGEPTLLDLIEHLADWVRDAPVLIVCLARPELLDGRPGWGGGKLNATSVLLEPLTPDESDELMENLSGDSELSDEARARIAAAAAGIPLFLEQMLAMLADSDDVGPEIAVPPAIQALIAARLDLLEPGERRVLERASIEGEIFHVGGVLELVAPETPETVGSLLMSLVRKELVHPEPPGPSGDTFGFRHALIRDAAYERLAKETRADLHARHAAWLEQPVGERVDEYEEFVGYHLEQAFRYRSELHGVDKEALSLADRAGLFLSRAGRSALRRGDIRAGINLLERARALPASDERTRLELAPDLGSALFETGELELALSMLTETIERAKVVGERQIEHHAWVVRELSRLFRLREQLDLAESLRDVHESLEVLGEAGDDVALLRAWTLLWGLHMCTGDAAAQREALERPLEHARRASSPPDEALNLAILGWWLVHGPTPVAEGIGISQRLLHERADEPLVEASIASIALANLMAMDGHLEDALALSARGRARVQELGSSYNRDAVELFGGARVETISGNLRAAEQTTRAVAERRAEVGDRWIYVVASLDLARTVCDRGRPAECLEILDESEQHPTPPDYEVILKRGTARALAFARLGRLEEAESLARETVGRAGSTEFFGWHADALVVLAEVLRLAGSGDEATNALEEAVALYEHKGNVVVAAQARALLDELR